MPYRISPEIKFRCLQSSVYDGTPGKEISTLAARAGHLFNEGDNRKESIFYSEENIKSVNHFLDKLKPLAASKNATLSQLVIAWTLSQPGITIVLVGARDTRQAIENARASEIKLTREEVSFVNAELLKLMLEHIEA